MADTDTQVAIPDDALLESVEKTATVSPNGDVVNLLTIEQQVKDRLAKLDQLREEIQPHKEMLTSYLENDEKFREATDLAKKASQNKTAVKKQLLSTQQGRTLVDAVDTRKADIKEEEEALSYYLREYQRLTGSNEFEGDDGELRTIVFMAKLVRKTNLNR